MNMLLSAYVNLIEREKPSREQPRYSCELAPVRIENDLWRPHRAAGATVDTAILDNEDGEITFRLDASKQRMRAAGR